MPWLAIPYSDSETRNRLIEFELFGMNTLPFLVIFDSNGNLTTADGINVVMEYEMDIYPFKLEIINSLLDKQEEAKKNHFLSFLMATRPRNYLISNDGSQVPISELEENTVALYFWPRDKFTAILIDAYNKLKAKSQKFEIVAIAYPVSLDEEEFIEKVAMMPWLALPFNYNTHRKLIFHFDTNYCPTLVILGPNGKILSDNAVEFVEVYGAEGYPFTPERLNELAEIDRARLDWQALESLLISGDKDFVITKGGSKVPVSELVGKTILLYIISPWSELFESFNPKLIETYNDIKAKDDAFEVIFISHCCDEDAFNQVLPNMPWLALPFNDAREKALIYKLKVIGYSCIVIDPSGRITTRYGQQLINIYGANAYPFSKGHLKHLEQEMDKMAKGWPKKAKHERYDYLEHKYSSHECSLTPNRDGYGCLACDESGIGWYYQCNVGCTSGKSGLHPKCAFVQKHEEANDCDTKGNGNV
ncbi:Thioredoxin-like fold containing protein [Trema orientale]|uniref:protein-disulfide reductase n=1 Tax=Trema orientale TaxID=63057 RepID=A0A2P5FT66_TREOI|nr:Thioredoxin-like fold containing protein [Trema orientale]